MWWMAVAQAADADLADRKNVVRAGFGLPYGLNVAYERRFGDHFALGAEAGTLLITGEYNAYARLYLSEGRLAPFGSLRAGESAAGGFATLWRGPMTGLDGGLQFRAEDGFVFEAKLGADVVFDPYSDVEPRIGGLASLVPQASVSFGAAF